MYKNLHVNYLLFLTGFNETWIFSTYFRKNPKISNFAKIRPVGAQLFHADRQMDTTLIVAFLNFAKALKIHSAERFLHSAPVDSRKFASFFLISSMYLQYGEIQCYSLYGARMAVVKIDLHHSWILLPVAALFNVDICNRGRSRVLQFNALVRPRWSKSLKLYSWFCLCHTLVPNVWHWRAELFVYFQSSMYFSVAIFQVPPTSNFYCSMFSPFTPLSGCVCGSLSPRHGASSGCGWRNGLRYGG